MSCERGASTKTATAASFLAAQIVGLGVVRHVVGLPPLAAATREELVRALTPVFEHYLHGPWVGGGGAPSD